MSKISERNDRLRTTLRPDTKNRVMLTKLVAESPDKEAILKAVREFNSFSEENDPYGEHDFGMMEVNGGEYCFKCDYFNHDLTEGADPEEEDYTLVLTIMEASER